MYISIIFGLLCFVSTGLTYNSDRFTEELLIKPLYSEQLYAHFQFSLKWDVDPDKEQCKHI